MGWTRAAGTMVGWVWRPCRSAGPLAQRGRESLLISISRPKGYTDAHCRSQVQPKEMVLTLEQAKHVKVQKGYALEPVLPGADRQEETIEGKRERKKSSHFGNPPLLSETRLKRSLTSVPAGYSPPHDQQHARQSFGGFDGSTAGTPAPTPKPRPKPRPQPPSQQPAMNGTPARVAPINAMQQAIQLNSPYAEKRRVLQVRVFGLNEHEYVDRVVPRGRVLDVATLPDLILAGALCLTHLPLYACSGASQAHQRSDQKGRGASCCCCRPPPDAGHGQAEGDGPAPPWRPA